MKSHGYAFVLTPMELGCPSNVEIAPVHRLKRADGNQVEFIKGKLQELNADPFSRYASPYENKVRAVPGDKPGEVQYFYDKLAPEDWKYWVVEFEGTNSELQELEWACALVPNDFELGFHVIFHESLRGPGFGWNMMALSSFFNHGFATQFTKRIELVDLDLVRRHFKEIKELPATFPHIRRALQRFDQLRWLPRRSEMVVIGLISVIESLVSHAPKLTDSADSLSHQLRTKLPLLRKRFICPLEHQNFFGEIDEENLWKKLYAYRSKIVHGEDSQLSGELVVLGKLEPVISFLRETSKRLLQLSLSEPQFMTDLKKC
jgi:hypothetical protein